MNLNRVVVTGLSALTPIGNDLDTSWHNLLSGVSGVGPITRFDASEYATRIAAEIKDFDDSAYLDKKSARRQELFTRYATACSFMALEDAGFPTDEQSMQDVGCLIGVGLGGLKTLEDNYEILRTKGPRRVNPFMIPVLIANMAAGQVSITHKAKGINYCTTSACASGLHAIASAYTEIMLGRAPALICGGAESTITTLAVSGFNAMRALSTRNDEPQAASRPFAADRDGFVMGEGCSILILESLEHAKARGARIVAEVVGYGGSGDAFHMTAPPEDGEGMARAMRRALAEAGLAPERIDHINAHATATPVGDICEIRAIREVFGDHADNIPVTANKSMIGHCLGGAGAIESVFTIKSLAEGVIPMTTNLDNPDPLLDLDVVTGEPRAKEMEYAMCNSFGFGGTNCTMIFRRYDDNA